MDRAQNVRYAFHALGERVDRALRTQRGDLARIRVHTNEVELFRREVEVVCRLFFSRTCTKPTR
jgi:hypothetical protein